MSNLDLQVSDQLLVRQLKQNSEKAFEILYEEYSQDIYAYSRSLLKSDSNAEEIVQDVFLKIWMNRTQLDPKLSFKSFLFTITRNLSFNFLKKAANNQRLREELFYKSQDSCPCSQDLKLIEAEYEVVKSEALSLLPPKRRMIFEMSRQEGKTYEDISSEMNISLSTVKTQMSKALQTIREHLQLHTDLTFVISIILANWFNGS